MAASEQQARWEGLRDDLKEIAVGATSHLGLWLDKGMAQPPETPKRTPIQALFERAHEIKVPEGYARAFERRTEALGALRGGIESGVTKTWDATAEGRIIVGLGIQSVRETNMALLHTWGVPYIPGSALKGLASSVAHRFGGKPSWNKTGRSDGTLQGEDHKIMFGDTTSVGCVVFHDAWWVPDGDKLPLDLDVMTVHHTAYYGGGAEAPLDWDEPIPVSFLTARGCYKVALSGPREWVARAGEWLEIGLEDEGIGAKTQAGYGRMTLKRALSRREQELAARIASLNALPAQHRGQPTALQHIQRLREALGSGIPPEEVYKVAHNLFERDKPFWRSWARDEKRSEEERSFLQASAMVKPEPTSVVVELIQPTTPTKSVSGRAWIESDKNGRQVVLVDVDGARFERKRKDVVIDDDALSKDLASALETAPVIVSVELRGNKILSVRRA
jgi:CRISPR type III-B/RAMP module RAMP protein Cmr6